MDRKEYIEPSYEVLLLNAGNVITDSSNRDPWETGEFPFPTTNGSWEQ